MTDNYKKPALTQDQVNDVWGEVWGGNPPSVHDIFLQRLFLEGYPVFKKYVPEGARSILEIGAGSGRYGLKFATEFPDAHVTLTDIVDTAILGMMNLKNALGLTNVTVQKEDAFRLSFAEDAFDVVFCDAVIQHIPQYQNAVKEMIRVLKPGGTLILSAVNSWNLPHTMYKNGLRLLGKEYSYGHERSFSGGELQELFQRYYMQNINIDGFYFAYGVYRWKIHHPIFRLIGGAINRGTKFLDLLSGRSVSRRLGFEVFAVGQKVALRVKHSGIVQIPSMENPELGTLMSGEGKKSIPFDIRRFYLIKDIPDFYAVRGGHAHKTLDQVIFCLSGSFQLRIDDGTTHQKFILNSSDFGVRLGPKLWHSMRQFSKDCVILVLASDHFDEPDYIRKYEDFKTYAAAHP